MRKLITSASLVACLALATGCPNTNDPGVPTGQFGVTVNFTNDFGNPGLVDCTTIELVVTSSAGDVFRDPGNCTDLTWATGLLPLEDYSTQVNVYDVNGQLSAQSDIIDSSLDVDGELVELRYDIVEDAASFAFSYLFIPQGADAKDSNNWMTCAEAGVSDVVLRATLDADSSNWDQSFPCADDYAVEVGDYNPLGDYTISMLLKDGGGNDVNGSNDEAASLDYGGQINDLGDFVFEFVTN